MSIFDTAATNQEPVIQPTAEELEQKKKDDSINPDFYLLGSKKWSEANNPVVRSEYASKITEKIRGVYSADKSLTVKNRVMREGKLVEEDSPAYDQKGNVTPEGESYFEKMEIYLKTAAAHETGGVRDNPFTGKKMVENGLSDIREEPRRNPIQFPDYADFERSEKEKIRGEGEEPNFGIGSYSRWRFQKDGKLSIDVLDDEVIKAFEDQKAFIEFDPKSFNKDEKFRMVGGFPKFNEDFLGDRQGVTDEILALEGVSGARKSEFLKEFAIESEKPVKEKMAFEKEVMDILTQNDRSSSSALKSLGDDNGDTRVLEDSWDGVKNTAGTILAVLEPTLQALGLANEGSLNLLERESFDPALRGGDLIKAYEDRLKSGDSTSASHAVVMGELIDKFRAKGIVDGVEMGNIMRDVVKKNVWAKGDPDKVRQLNDGEIVFNPSSISARSPDEVHNAIKAQNTTAEKKEALTREYDFRRSYFASVLNDQLVESDNDYKEHRKQMEASGVSDPSKILYSWKGLEDGFGGSYGWTGTTGNAIWDPLAQAGRGIANAGWSGLAMASSAASEGAGKLGLEGISNWLKASTVGSVNQIQENEMLTARDESLAALRGERNGTRAVIKDIATSGLQMIPMFVGGAAGGAIKATAGANKGVAMLGTSVQSLGVFGYAGLQGVQSIYETAIMKGEQKAMQEGRKMSEDERYGVIADNWKPALVNGIQTAMLTKLLSGSGTQRMALGKLGAGGQGITIRELASQFKNTVGKSGWSKATVRASLAELKPEIGKLTATLIHDVAGETIEETLNQVFEGFITKATLNPDKSYNDIAGEAIVAGLEGGFLGGAIPAGKSAMFGNDKSAHQNAIKYAMMQQYQEKLVALDKAGNTDPNANSSGDLLDHFNFVADKTKAYQKLRKEKNYSGAEAINVEIDQATKVLSEKLGVETVDPKAYERFAGNKMAPALAAIMSTDQIPHEVKEQALLDAARGEDSPLLLHSVDVDSEASTPPVVGSEAPLAEAPPAPPGEARTGGVVDVLSKLGYNPGKNREFVETADAPVFDKPVKFGNIAIEAITVGSQPFAGARVTTTLPDGTKEVTHVSSAKALEMVPEKGKFDFGRKNSAILREGFTNAAENHESNIKEWSKDGITKPAAAATSATAEAAKKDGAPIAPAGGTTITPPSAKAASSVEENPLTKAKAEVAAATDEELAVHATTPISGSMNFHRGEAVDRLKAEGKWDEKNNKPLFKAGQPVAYENSKGETVDGVFSGYDSDGAKAIVSVGDKTHRGAVSKLRAISLPKESSTPSIEPSSAESSASPAPKAPTPSLLASLKEALKASSVPASELTKATESYYGQSEESRDEIQAGVAKRLESDEEVMKHITVKGTEKKGTIIADYGNPAGPHEIEYSSKKEKASALERAKETIRDGRPMFEMFDASRKNMDAYHTQLRAQPIIPLAPSPSSTPLPAIIPKALTPTPTPTAPPAESKVVASDLKLATAQGRTESIPAALSALTDGGKVEVKARPAAAGFEKNQGQYKGDAHVWSHEGKVYVDPSYVASKTPQDKQALLDELKQKAAALGFSQAKEDKTLNASSSTNTVAGADILSNSAVQTDPLAPMMSVESDVLEGKTKSPFLKGAWSKDGDTYYYTPEAMTTLPLGRGTLIAIRGSDEVLVMNGVVNGVFAFTKLNFARVAEMESSDSMKRVAALSRNWNNTLMAKVAPHFLPVLQKMVDGKLSKAETRKLLHEVMKIVAPGRSVDSIAEADLPKGKFFQAFRSKVEISKEEAGKTKPDADGKYFKFVPGVRVDYRQLASELSTLVSGHKMGDAAMDTLVALDASRQLATWMGEENIHTLTLDPTKFSEQEIEEFYTAINNDPSHPFHDLLKVTAQEQFPDSESLDPEDNGEGYAYTVASEMLRKLQQIRQTGSTSEINAAYATSLIAAINDNKITAKFKTTIALVKRFFERMRRMLYLSQQMGEITPAQKELLGRLNDEYLKAGFNEDVDQIKAKKREEVSLLANTYIESTRADIDKVAMKRSQPLLKLREVTDEVFENIGIRGLVMVDAETGALTLNPIATGYLEENHPDFDTKAIQDALDELSENDSFKKSLTQSFFLDEVAKARLAELSFDPAELYDWIGGKADINPNGVISHVLAGAPSEQRYGVVMDYLQEALEDMQQERALKVSLMHLKARATFAKLDMSKPKDVRRALAIAVKMGLESTTIPRDPNAVQIGTEQWKQWVMAQAYRPLAPGEELKDLQLRTSDELLARSTGEKGFLAVEALTERIDAAQAKLEALRQLDEDVSKEESDAVVRGKIDRMRQEATLLDDNARAAGRSHSKEAVVMRLKAQFMTAELGKDTSIASARYAQFSGYMQALKDYNESIDGVLHRAIGRNNPDNREFGLHYQDTSFNINKQIAKPNGKVDKGSKSLPLGPITATAPVATTPNEVFGFNVNNPAEEKSNAELIGYGNPRYSKASDGARRELVDAHYRAVFGNAKLRGRHAKNWFMLQDALGNIAMDMANRDDFFQTAGFNLEAQFNEKLELRKFETPHQAFPGLNLYDRLFFVTEKMRDREQAQSPGKDFAEVVSILKETKEWADGIRSKINQDGAILEINGEQTLAGASKLLLDARLRDFDLAMRNFEATLNPLLNRFFRGKVNEFGSDDGFMMNEGGLISKTTTSEGLYEAFNQSLNSFDKFGASSIMVQAMSSLNTAVKLTRRSLQAFQDKNWQDNMEHEMHRTLSDYAYVPDHKELLQLREQKLDPSVMRNLGWIMRFYNKGKGYSVGSLHAYELINEQLKGEWSNDGKLLVTKHTRPLRANNMVSEDELGNLSMDDEASGLSAIADLENGGHTPLAFATGEQGNTRDSAINEKVGETQSTAEGRNQREVMTPYQIQRNWLTRSLMFLGYGRGRGEMGSADNAREFAFEVIKQAEGTSKMEFYELMKKGLAGAFTMVDPSSEAFESLVERFVATNPEWNFAFGQRSEGPFQSEAAKEMYDKLGNDPFQFDPETFASDILRFKATFETDAIEKIRIGEGSKLTQVYESILSFATMDHANEQLNADNPNFNLNSDGAPSLTLPSEMNEQTASWARAFKYDMNNLGGKGGSKIGLFDARALEARKDMEGSLVGVDDVLVSEGLFVDNPALGVLLQNEPGENVFVYVPSVKAMKQFDLRHGVKVMSYNGMTVIVTPQGVRSSREEIKEALRGSMLRHASSSPEATAAINGLAARTMEMFSPVFRAQQLLAGLKDERQSIIDLAIHHPAYTGSSEQIAQTDDNIRQMLKQRLSRHMVKTARLFSSNGLAMRNTSFMGRVEKGELVSDRLGPKVKGQKNIRSYATEASKLPNINQDFQNQLEDNVDFLTNVLTDPQFKEMYDAAFLGTDEIENNNLSDTTNVQMFGAIHGILNTLDSDEEGFGDEVQVLKDDEHQEDAERAQEEATREREAKETAMEELIDQLAEDMGAEVKSDGTILDPEDSSVSPNPDSVNDLLKSIGALVADDARKEQERFKLNGEEHVVSPGDAALFNMFSTIVTSAKEKLADVDLDSLLVEGESPKRMLDNLADPGSLGGPIIRTINRPIRGAENDIVAAGDWVNITRASHAGHTSQTIAFAFSRQSKMRAGLLAQLDSVKAIMDKAAAAQIKKDLQKDPRRVEHATVKINIPLTAEFIEEMDKATDGLMTKHIEESKAMVSSLYFDQARFEKGLRDITAKIESLKATPDENDAALNLFLDSVKDWHEVGINTMVATLKSQIRSAIEENHYEGSTRQAARVLRQQVLSRVDSNARLKALKESAQTKLKEIERLASLQFHQMNPKEGEKDSSLTVPLKLAVEAFNGTMDSFEKSLRQVVKEGLGAKDSAGVKINLSLPRATWSKTMSPQDMAKLKKALNQGVSVGALNEVIKEVQLSRTAQSAAANLSHGKGSKSFAAIIKRMVEVYDESGDAGLSKEFNTLLDQLANDGGDTSNQAKGQTPVKGEMRELLRHFVLNDEEAKAMFLAGAQTTTQRNQLMKAEQFRETIKRALADTNKSIQTILKTKDGQQLGRYHHDITAGLAKGVDPVTRQITSVAIPPSNRQVPISMRLVPSSYEASTQLGSSLVEEQTNFMENEAQRIDFYAKREGVLRALSEFSAGPLESAFKKIRGSTEQFSKFNPFEMVKQSIALVNIEKAIISESMEEAKKLATAAEQRGMTIEAIAILSDPANGKEMYTVNQQKRVAFYKTPKGFSERSKLIGHLFDDGKPVILMSQNARQNLIEAFPAITKHTVDSSMNEIALDALSVRKAVAAKNTKDSYMLEFTKSYVKGKFQHDGFSALAGKLDANGNITREDAANAFVAEFKTKIQNFVEDNGKNPLVGLRDAAGLRVLSADEKLDMTNPQVEKVINLFSDMIRKIVYSSNHKEVSKDADKKIRHFLLSLSEDEFDDLDDPTIKHPGFSGNEKSMMDFDLMGTFSTAFSEIEGQALLKRLMAGLSVHGGWDSPMMMKYLHGQDSRIRARFLKNHVAHDTAIHLQAFLELGFNGESGRENAETQIQDVRAKLADSVVTIGKSTSAGLVKKTWEGLKGVDSLDASIAKDIATLEGIKRNRGMGVKVGLEVFRSAYLIGYKGLLQYDLAQRSAYKNFGSKFFNSKHIQLTDDIPMAKEKDALLRPGLLQIMANMGVSNGTPEADEAEALKVIDGMIANLLKGRKNAKQIKDHADLVEKEMRGINDAMALSRAVLSKPATTPEAEAHNQWKHDAVTPFQASYSSVPLSFAYAAGPGNRINDSDAKYIADPALISSIAEGSIYGGPGRDVMSLKNGRAVYRPLQVNGITSVNSLIEDSIYRMNVAPNYEVLRRLVGRVSDNSGIPVTVEAQMITNSWRNMGNSHDAIVGFGQALAAVATELESNLQNDAQQGVDSTRFAKVMDIATTNFIVRALGSPWQLVNQTAGPTVAVFAKKLLTLQVREATDFAMALSKIVVSGAAANLTPDFLISNQQPFKSFNQRLNNFTREVSIFVNKRGFDGTDNTKNVVRHQVLHGSSVGRQVVNKIGNEVQAMGESILDHTIGASERVLGRAVFAMELMSELRQAKALGDFTGTVPSTLEELMSMKSKDIPTLAKARARIKVSDLLGQGDQAKKSSPFQNHSNSPTFTAVFKSISRFSSQQSSTAANVQVFGKALYMAAINKALHQENPDLRVLRDAVENIAGTITQNVLFHVFKVHTIVPLVLYLFNGGGGDEQKRSSRRAQMLANKLMAPSEEGVDGSPADFLKSIFFGPKKEFFRLDKNEEASKASAFAGLLSKAMTDMAAAAPSVGVTTGFSSTTEMWRWWTNKGAIEIMASKALGYDLKMAQAYHDKNSVGIDTYDSGFLDSLMSVTAPTALLSDYSQAAKRIYKGMNTPSVTPLEIALNVISEAVPITPEFRRQTSKEIRDKVKMRTPKKDVGRPGW
jgi:hypothetical protein